MSVAKNHEQHHSRISCKVLPRLAEKAAQRALSKPNARTGAHIWILLDVSVWLTLYVAVCYVYCSLSGRIRRGYAGHSPHERRAAACRRGCSCRWFEKCCSCHMLPIPSGLALLRTLVTKVVSRVSQLKINQDRKEANATTKGKKTKAKTQKKAAPKKPAKKKAEKVCKRPAKKIKKPAAAPPAHPADIQNEGEEESSVAEDPELTEHEAEAAAAPSTKNKAPEAKAKAKGKAPKAKAKGKAKKDTKSSKDRGSPKPKKKGKELSEAEPLACIVNVVRSAAHGSCWKGIVCIVGVCRQAELEMKIFIKEYNRVGTHNYRLMAYWSRHGFGLSNVEDDHQAPSLHLKA